MKTSVTPLTGGERERWDSFVDRAEGSTFFHRSPWLSLVGGVFDCEALHVIAEKESNIVSCLPLFAVPLARRAEMLVSSPLGIGSMVLGSSKKEAVDGVLEEVKGLLGRKRCLAHRIVVEGGAHLQYADLFGRHGYRCSLDGVRVILAMKGALEEVESRYSKSRRQEVAQVLGGPLSFRETELDGEKVERFYRLYRSTMERVGGKTRPIELFSSLASLPGEDVRLLVAESDGEWAAGNIYGVERNRRSVYHLYGASDERFRRHLPNVFLHCRAIRLFHSQGYLHYNMYGTSFYSSPVFGFKKQWGGEIIPVGRFERPAPGLKGLVFRAGKAGAAYRRRSLPSR